MIALATLALVVVWLLIGTLVLLWYCYVVPDGDVKEPGWCVLIVMFWPLALPVSLLFAAIYLFKAAPTNAVGHAFYGLHQLALRMHSRGRRRRGEAK